MSDFFITLVSNSSVNIFPNNTTSSFTVLLSEIISLKGRWEVAIAEIHYNYNFLNVTERNNKIILTRILSSSSSLNNDKAINDIPKIPFTVKLEVPTGYYNSVHDLIKTINLQLKLYLTKGTRLFSLDDSNNRTYIHKENLCEGIESIFLEGRLNMQLGFEPHHDIWQSETAPHIGNICFGIPDQMMIYTDIIEPSFIGSEKAYVLKIVNTEPRQFKFGDACYREYNYMHYMRVQNREFESISIDIRDHTGNFMPFQHGILMLKLHFKHQNEA